MSEPNEEGIKPKRGREDDPFSKNKKSRMEDTSDFNQTTTVEEMDEKEEDKKWEGAIYEELPISSFSSKWDKLEGRLSEFIDFDQLKKIETGSLDNIFDVPNDEELSDMKPTMIPFIFDETEEFFLSRFEKDWVHIPTNEKNEVFNYILGTKSIRRGRLHFTGPKGF